MAAAEEVARAGAGALVVAVAAVAAGKGEAARSVAVAGPVECSAEVPEGNAVAADSGAAFPQVVHPGLPPEACRLDHLEVAPREVVPGRRALRLQDPGVDLAEDDQARRLAVPLDQAPVEEREPDRVLAPAVLAARRAAQVFAKGQERVGPVVRPVGPDFGQVPVPALQVSPERTDLVRTSTPHLN